MGREVRRVPADWGHPIDPETGRYKPLLDGSGYADRLREWNEENAKWSRGEFPDYADEASRKMSYSEWNGDQPKSCDYMPAWPDAMRTHLMMYEDTSEGTPISPAFETPEELARWLVDNKASAFGRDTGSYEGWLRVARGGFAPSMVVANGVIASGVDAPNRHPSPTSATGQRAMTDTTDRELLERAARAAGMETQWDRPRGSKTGVMRARLPMSGLAFPVWNPLTSSADAFELAVKLRIDVFPPRTEDDSARAMICLSHKSEYAYQVDGDPAAACRRAITRAAASMDPAPKRKD